MSESIAVLRAHAREVPAAARHELAVRLRAGLPAGTVRLETCHRVEAYGDAAVLSPFAEPGVAMLAGEAAVRHVVSLAAGRASTVLLEDQVLHQLRVAVADARSRGPLDPALDRLLDVALRAGRRARSWLPGRRPSLADVALDAVLPEGAGPGWILVVGAGEMGTLAARAAARRGRPVRIASRTAARSARLAAAVGAAPTAFDPEPADLAGVGAIVVALAGAWPLRAPAAAALVDSRAPVVDLSAPPALDGATTSALGDRYRSIDDLATAARPASSDALARRLDRLVDESVAAYLQWHEAAPDRAAARALADRADAARAAELEMLWRRLPGLDPAARAEVEQMADRLATRLLRDPLERLARDGDGRHRRAARELFGL